MLKEEVLRRLEESCRHHNYYYRHSSSYSDYSTGSSTNRHIQSMLKRAKEGGYYEEAKAIYDKHAPTHLKNKKKR